MSYDISLYDRAFLIRALTEQLGDWTNAPPIPEAAVEALLSLAQANGFVPAPVDPAFIVFCREEGFEPGTELALDTSSHLAGLTLHRGQVAFSIPYSSRSASSIALCADIARTIARRFGLGYNDPQTGEEP